MMKKCVILFSLIFVFVSLCACGASAPHAQQDKTDSVIGEDTSVSFEDVPVEYYEYEIVKKDCERDGLNISGEAYVPKREGKLPLVIFAHELGSTHRSGIPYAECLANHGIAAYVFDFCGGSVSSRSDGSTVGMSVMTEAADMEAVLEAAQQWDFVDSDKIVLIGASQGGVASAVVAAREPEKVNGLVLLYPAFVIRDTVQDEFDSIDEVPEQFNFNGWIMVGRNYVTDVWDYDVYAEMKNFQKPVLLLHGNRDSLVDISYSERAAEAYPDAELEVLDGAGHGFYGNSFEIAMDYILSYLTEIGV